MKDSELTLIISAFLANRMPGLLITVNLNKYKPLPELRQLCHSRAMDMES